MKLLFEGAGPSPAISVVLCDCCGVTRVAVPSAEAAQASFVACDTCTGEIDEARAEAYDAAGVADDYAIDQARDDRDERRYA